MIILRLAIAGELRCEILWGGFEKLGARCGVAAGRNLLGGRVEVAIAGGGALDADGALFEVGLARDGVEGAERDVVGVGFGEVEGHEDLAGSHDGGDAEFDIGDEAAAAGDGDAIVGA
jgi:hypothetical protein